MRYISVTRFGFLEGWRIAADVMALRIIWSPWTPERVRSYIPLGFRA
jgi:hypothetical protein